MADHSILRRLLPAIGLALVAGLMCAWLLPDEMRAVEAQLAGFPDSDVFAHRLRPLMLGILFFLPAIGALLFACSGVLDRYLMRQFLPIFCLCLAGLLLIWLLIDLADNLEDLRRSPTFLTTTVRFYSIQAAPVLIVIVPYALLLALLYSLGRLSRSRELVAMIQTGRGVMRLMLPLLIFGLLATAACVILNYHWAPWAEGFKEGMLVEARGGRPSQARNVLYFETNTRRLWKVGSFPVDHSRGAPLRDVEVTQLHPDGTIDTRLLAPRAIWDRDARSWTFEDALLESFRPGLHPEFRSLSDPLVRHGWPETPWQLIKPGLPAPFLGIPDLNSWLLTNRNVQWADKLPYLTHWHHRWAQPFICMVTVMIAVPLGIVFSRRGTSGGIALAVFLCGGMLFCSTVALALGESGYLPPPLAAWLTNIAFGVAALYLFRRRMTGRPIYQTIRRMMPLED
jgi:lipopolysaccharide export system permease protein